MKKIVFLSLVFLCLLDSKGQERKQEVGLDLNFFASNFGGSGGGGLKYGVVFQEKFIVGPSIRCQYVWNKNIQTGFKNNYAIYGGGAFFHARFFDALFVGTEIEFLRTPFNYNFAVQAKPLWVPTAFIGGGFSKEFNESWRLNAGIFYDVINDINTPFYSSYIARNKNGVPIPMIYRIGFFFPLN